MALRIHEWILLVTTVISLFLNFVVFPLLALSGTLIGGWCPPMLGVHFINFVLWLIGFGYYGYTEVKGSKGGVTK